MSAEANQRLAEQLGAASAAAALPTPLTQSRPADVLAAHEIVRAALVTMRTQIASLLGVTLQLGDALVTAGRSARARVAALVLAPVVIAATVFWFAARRPGPGPRWRPSPLWWRPPGPCISRISASPPGPATSSSSPPSSPASGAA